ncbi:hypothetical protein ACFQL1_03105 [Halomicroarcula sp. GCM10025709]
MPFIENGDNYFLSSGSLDTFHVSREELIEFVQLEEVPVRIDGELRWSTALQFEKLL